MNATLEVVNDIFDEYDTNKDGELDFEEAKKFLIKMIHEDDDGEPDDTFVKQIFDNLDENKDGKLDRSEIGKFMEAMFSGGEA